VYKKQLLLKESELKSLQSQINPHFLFNVLETISWRARMSNNDEIYQMITSLGYLLRASFATSGIEKVKISEEMHYIEFYLLLQKKRFEEKLEIEINNQIESLDIYYVPKLSVQPIVENAIVHGLEQKIGNGKLTITMYIEHEDIVFEIHDNGVGFQVADVDLREMNSSFKSNDKHSNIGLFNSNRRIKLLYGEAYGITLESQINMGTKVTLRIPKDRADI
jgi:two-component system sensor histidine kinase YesM